MKNLFAIVAVVIAFVGFTSMQTGKGEFKFEKETHDFNSIPVAKPASYEFKFTNGGSEPIIISDVKPACGCSVAEFTKTPIKPGDAGVVKVTYNAASKGPFTKSFTVTSNTKTPVKTLYIKGIVE
ncbi:hypothetical protein HMPREF0765_4290 [Sphingobacterium spiritivorum ATCC 33300]|uniref:Protein of uncharacterized function (DUF1573) n=2 Tax=Sphingobacterium spiritivorum TaxID=258 RepID=A0A380CQ06_SPHSI|nr:MULTISPECIES: DUF1573 domain-containing protein [Sphingobacterium]EEI90136.1 hypothetical protein HMPREF0765_4290 [Sphingobacterium spiritivorum ATCC 33300]QQS95040.1 DUF1573 domain-containing protein [Sphingobacterium spiritivorum]QQT26333.1 DUF1573 domain-containing protein [Sphingobacterium spiritivorum]SUJ24600.1 Protein of uncharacterised function (DUF1573) [Sphingobacterium spiritivorum]